MRNQSKQGEGGSIYLQAKIFNARVALLKELGLKIDVINFETEEKTTKKENNEVNSKVEHKSDEPGVKETADPANERAQK
jgi:hypothetical protein